jgi:hypothetical protein
VCGANAPPGRSYLAEGQLVNCGYRFGGRMPLVEMKDALSFWLFALGPPKDHERPTNGVSEPRTSNS